VALGRRLAQEVDEMAAVKDEKVMYENLVSSLQEARPVRVAARAAHACTPAGLRPTAAHRCPPRPSATAPPA
jgi:hypothetical protein